MDVGTCELPSLRRHDSYLRPRRKRCAGDQVHAERKGLLRVRVLDFPNYRLKAEILWEEGLQDDRSAEFMETILEIKRFFWGWSSNGCLEVWAEGTECLSRCEAFMPVNVMLDPRAFEEQMTKLKTEVANRPRRSQPPEPCA